MSQKPANLTVETTPDREQFELEFPIERSHEPVFDTFLQQFIGKQVMLYEYEAIGEDRVRMVFRKVTNVRSY